MFRNGGIWSWVLLLVFLVGGLATLIVGIVIARRPRAPLWLLWVPSFVTGSIAWLGYALSMRRLEAVLEAVDRDVKARILSEGTSESLSVLLFGSAYVALLLTLALLFAGFRALGHGQRTKLGVFAVLAICGGLVLTVLSVPGGALVAARLGGSGVALFFAVPTLVATILAAAFVGTAMGGESQPDAYAGPAGDAWATLAMASCAIVAWLARGYVSMWSIVFGATSGESVDPAQAARIFQEGALEARAVWPSGAALLVPVVASLAIGLFARPSAAGTGLGRAWSSLVFGVLVGAMFGVLPPLAVDAAQARIEAATEVPWPSEIDAVVVDRAANIGLVEGELLFYGRGKVWIGGASEPAAAASPAECAALEARAGGHAGRAIALGPDATTPASVLACFARAAEEAARGAPEDPLYPGRPRKGAMLFLVQTHPDPARSHVVTSSIRPDAIALGFADVPPRSARLHLTRGGSWRFRSYPAAPEETGKGRPPLVSDVRAAPPPNVFVTFDPDVTAQELLLVLAGLHANLTLGAAEAAAFEPPPTGKWRARVQVDSADGVDRAVADGAFDARRPALEQCEVDTARTLPTMRFDVLANGTLRAIGPPPTADLLATCARVALLGTVLPKPKRAARVAVSVSFARSL
jgi:hypothetical protein